MILPKQLSIKRGFTLIELLVVIAIIGLLSSVILTSLNIAREKSYDATRKTNLVEIQKALQGYYDDNGVYPKANGAYTGLECGQFGNISCNYTSQCSVGGNVPQNNVISALVSGGYISQLPTDSQMVPSTNTCCYEYLVNSTGSDYKYMFFGCSATGSTDGTGLMTDSIHTGAWSVYSPAGAAL